VALVFGGKPWGINMKIYFSKSNKAFYVVPVFEGVLPEDSVEISQDIWENLIQEQNNGLVIQGNSVGYPVAVPRQFSDVEIKSQELSWIEQQLIFASNQLELVQDSDTSSFGSVQDWRTYRKALRAWSSDPNFPDKNFRPESPR
jgi:hypothetical protein